VPALITGPDTVLNDLLIADSLTTTAVTSHDAARDSREAILAAITQPSLLSSATTHLISGGHILTPADVSALSAHVNAATDIIITSGTAASARLRRACEHASWIVATTAIPATRQAALSRTRRVVTMAGHALPEAVITAIVRRCSTSIHDIDNAINAAVILAGAGTTITDQILDDLTHHVTTGTADVVRQAADGTLDAGAWVAVAAARTRDADTLNWAYSTRTARHRVSGHAAAAAIAARLPYPRGHAHEHHAP